MALEPPRYPDVRVQLTGQYGNSFNLLGLVRRALKEHRVPREEVDAFFTEAVSGDYPHLLRTCMRWVNVS